MLTIDPSFDFRSDTPPQRDPDRYSPTLRNYHRLLWSKPLPSGYRFELLPSSGSGYLTHRSSLGEFELASDGIIHSYLPTKRMAQVINQVPSETSTALENLGFTIGGFIIFPGNRVDKKMTINGARGCHRKIEDRFDLTLECIRRHYENTESPLTETLKRYSDFFDLFRDFKGYTEFFFLQDLVTEGGDGVRFFLPFDNFQRQAFPIDADEYRTYAKCATDFLNARSARMISSNKGAVR